MKIALDGSFLKFPFTGIGRYTELLLKQYLRIFPHHKYLLYRLVGLRHFFSASQFPSKGLEPVAVKTPFIWGSLMQRLRDFGPVDSFFLKDIDVFHGHAPYLPSLTHEPTVVMTIHDVIPLLYPEYVSRSAQVAWSSFGRKLPAISKFIADSESTKNDFMREFNLPPEKIVVIPLAVSSLFTNLKQPPETAEITASLGLDGEFILTVGRIEPRKNLLRLIQAYDKLRQTKKFSGKLVIVGAKGWDAEKFEEALRKSPFKNDILWLGYLPDTALVSLYHAASVFAFVSLYEGFGFPLLEAFACGVPVVASSASSLPEIGGEAAIYVNPFDTEAICQGLDVALHDQEKRTELVQKGRTRLSHYSWEKTARETFKHYEL